MKKEFIIFLAAISVIIVVISGFFIIPKKQALKFSKTLTPTPSQAQTKVYKSESMDFEVSIPYTCLSNELSIRVSLKCLGDIVYIDKTASNFDSLDEHFKNLDIKQHPKIIEEKDIKIAGYDTKVRIYDNVPSNNTVRKSYYVFIDGWVYSIFTSSEKPFDLIDQIAQSFKYTPN